MIRRIFQEEEVFNLELKAHGRVQYDLGRSAERERIIALLKNLIGEREAAIYIDEFIALIGGEN